MFSIEFKPLNPRTIHGGLLRGDQPVTFGKACRLMQSDGKFRQMLVEALIACPFTGFRWETPPVCDRTLDREFEFVLLDSPGLVRPVDDVAFADQFSTSELVVVFENLGRDALLIVPCPGEPRSCYSDLASFLRNASEQRIHRFWEVVGKAMLERVRLQRSKPVWLSTAGMGVAWLHIRLDSYPKYYGYPPYRQWNLRRSTNS